MLSAKNKLKYLFTRSKFYFEQLVNKTNNSRVQEFYITRYVGHYLDPKYIRCSANDIFNGWDYSQKR